MAQTPQPRRDDKSLTPLTQVDCAQFPILCLQEAPRVEMVVTLDL